MLNYKANWVDFRDRVSLVVGVFYLVFMVKSAWKALGFICLVLSTFSSALLVNALNWSAKPSTMSSMPQP